MLFKVSRWSIVLLFSSLIAGCLGLDGVLKIGSDPGDAQVFINGVWQGNTGLKTGEYLTLNLRQGVYVVECRKEVDDENELFSRREVVVKGGVEQVITVGLSSRFTQYGIQRQRELAEMKRQQERGEQLAIETDREKSERRASEILDSSRESEARPTPTSAHSEKQSRAEVAGEALDEPAITDLGRLDINNIVAGLMADLVLIPEGSFVMGSMQNEPDEKPTRTVSVSSFRIMAAAVTFDMWDACFVDRGCYYIPPDREWGRGNRPVIYVSYNDIVEQFIPWINLKTGKVFRLPSEAEWEYAARAGTTTNYPWGDSIVLNAANCLACGSQWDGKKTAPVKSFQPNYWGLYEMLGNVYEWTSDCWVSNYYRAPNSATPWAEGDCSQAPIRGGSWSALPQWVRSANRDADSRHYRFGGLGFRLALDAN